MAEFDNLVIKGKTLLQEEKFVEALSFFEQALIMKPDDPDLWNQKGIVLRSLGRYEEAMECFNKSLQLDPRDRGSS